MRTEVEIDGGCRNIMCDVENNDSLVAVDPLEQSLVDDWPEIATDDQLNLHYERLNEAWAEYRTEILEYQAECMRDDG